MNERYIFFTISNKEFIFISDQDFQNSRISRNNISSITGYPARIFITFIPTKYFNIFAEILFKEVRFHMRVKPRKKYWDFMEWFIFMFSKQNYSFLSFNQGIYFTGLLTVVNHEKGGGVLISISLSLLLSFLLPLRTYKILSGILTNKKNLPSQKKKTCVVPCFQPISFRRACWPRLRCWTVWGTTSPTTPRRRSRVA